jgi:hypothetical protein
MADAAHAAPCVNKGLLAQPFFNASSRQALAHCGGYCGGYCGGHCGG